MSDSEDNNMSVDTNPYDQMTLLEQTYFMDEMKKVRERCDMAVMCYRDNSMDWNDKLTLVVQVFNNAVAKTSVKRTVIERNAVEIMDMIHALQKDEREEWQAALVTAKDGDWRSFFEISRLRNSRVSLLIQEPPMQFQAARLHAMFNEKYIGLTAEEFYAALGIYDQIYKPDRHFGRFISILQSSGTGKSRMLWELRHKVPTLSVCVRSGDHPTSGWPPRDTPAYFYFRRPDAKFKGEELAAAFLGAVMEEVSNKLALKDCPQDPRALMNDWDLNLPEDPDHSVRNECFAAVVKRATDLLSQYSRDLVHMRPNSPKANKSHNSWHHDLFAKFCSASVRQLSSELHRLGQTTFVLAFDECSELNDVQAASERSPPDSNYAPLPYMSLIALLRIIKAQDHFIFYGVKFWYPLLDTASSVFDLLPTGPNAPSFRLTKALAPLPPWLYLGFNQMTPNKCITATKTARQLLTIGHLKMYGRPYWSQLDHMNEEVLNAGKNKLFPSGVFNYKDQNQVLAVFSVRVCLELSESEASSRLAAEAVRSHMRILIEVSGKFLATECPSEPVLAVVAAQALNDSSDRYAKAFATLLDKLILQGLVIDRGLQGELCSRILLTLARDRAIGSSADFVHHDDAAGYAIEPVRCSEFLKSLLHDNLGLPDSDNNARERLFAEVKDVWINFTHFVQLSEPIHTVTEDQLCSAWSRGCAFQCSFHQPVIDGFLVGYAGNLDEVLRTTDFVLIPWQTKAKAEAAGLALASGLTAPFLAAATLGSVRTKLRHVSLLMDLGTDSRFNNKNGPLTQLTFGRAVVPTGRGSDWQGYASGKEHEVERYCLNVRGHSASTYPVLRGFEDQFHQLFERSLSATHHALRPYKEGLEKAISVCD